MRPLVCIVIVLVLSGCAKTAAEREVADDAACRSIVAQRNDTRPTAYQECRANLMEYERQRSVRASSPTIITR